MTYSSGNYKFFISIRLHKCVYQIMQSFFRNNSCKKQYISVFFKTVFFCDYIGFLFILNIYSVRYENRFSAVSFFEIVTRSLRQYNKFICIFRRRFFAEFEKFRGKSAPFGSLPIKSVYCRNGMYSE